MGSSTESDVVPFQAMVYEESNYDVDDEATPAALRAEEEFEDPHKDAPATTEHNGWTIHNDRHPNSFKMGKKRRIYATRWTKGDLTIGTMNQSEYVAGGAMEWTILADQKEAIEAFLADHGLVPAMGIVEYDTVNQTM